MGRDFIIHVRDECWAHAKVLFDRLSKGFCGQTLKPYGHGCAGTLMPLLECTAVEMPLPRSIPFFSEVFTAVCGVADQTVAPQAFDVIRHPPNDFEDDVQRPYRRRLRAFRHIKVGVCS